MRPHHPFEGQQLEVFGWQQRGGEVVLLLVLPDGTRSLIPASWTDLHGSLEPPRATLACITQLLHARIVVDALLRRPGASNREASQHEVEDGVD